VGHFLLFKKGKHLVGRVVDVHKIVRLMSHTCMQGMVQNM